VTAWGEGRQLRQLVTNLVDNAIKFTPSGGSVTVRLRSLVGDMAELQVQDTGVGIPAADIPRIFERFYQVDRARQRGPDQRGNGLGLSICNAIIQNHGGRVDVASRIAEGTTITILLPEKVPVQKGLTPQVLLAER
jgi:two-component system sensor histidine kinase VicK